MPVDLIFRNHIGILTLNRPEALNAMDHQLQTDLEKAIKAGKVVVIDVNGKNSQTKRGVIPTAVAFSNAKALAKQLAKTKKDTLVVAYCGGPSCSAYKKGATAAEALGFKNVKHLSAGISGWLKAGKKLAKK